MQSTLSLPLPEGDLLKHTQTVANHIRIEILQNGPISFARFMELALYTPGLGYYSAGLKKFGKEGDFTTAPEISPLFSKCLARQCAEVLSKIHDGDILEVGAGQGTMATEILLELERLNQLPKKYHILDLSADLINRQKELFSHRIPHLLPRIHWLTSLENFYLNGVILANEVLDAMPIVRFTFKDHILYEYFIEWDNEFKWLVNPADNFLLEAIRNLNIEFSDGYTSEINLQLSGWLKAMSHALNQGVLLIADYGFPRHEYYHPDRDMGTLMCHYRHRAHANPLVLPGIQDITAHVDFTTVAEEAFNHHFEVAGYTTQMQFLMSCGITDMMPANADISILNQIKLLLMPAEMGELVKFIALSKNWHDPLLGFKLKDLSEKL